MSNRYLEKIASFSLRGTEDFLVGAATGAIGAGSGTYAYMNKSRRKHGDDSFNDGMKFQMVLDKDYGGDAKNIPIHEFEPGGRFHAKKAEVQASDIAAPVIGAGVGVSAGTALGKRIVDKAMGDKVVRLSKGVQRVNDLADRNHQQRMADARKFRGDQEKSIRASSIIPTEVKPELYEKLKENEKSTIDKSVKDSTDRMTKRYSKINRVAAKMEKGIINKGRLVGGAIGLGIGGAIAYGMHKKDKHD